VAQWVRENDPSPDRGEHDPPDLTLPSGCSVARDQGGQWVVLLPAAYLVDILKDRNEGFEFVDSPLDL